MRKKGCYHKNRPFRLLVAAALRFVQSYLNDIASMRDSEKQTVKHGGSISAFWAAALCLGRDFAIMK